VYSYSSLRLIEKPVHSVQARFNYPVRVQVLALCYISSTISYHGYKMTQETSPITPTKMAPLGNVIGRSPRESTLESADQAAGIYSLYGEPPRDSWQSSSSEQPTVQVQSGRSSHPRTPLRNSITETDLEEMKQEYSSNGNVRMSIGTVDGDISRSSTTSQIPTPEIRLTPSKRPQDSVGVHNDIARLSPSPRHPLGGSTTSNTSSMSTSRISSAGSSQYPGEEEDAFHVRSTCMSSSPRIQHLDSYLY